jgi:hypothetical protein
VGHEEVVWAKLAAMVEGARLASQKLWSHSFEVQFTLASAVTCLNALTDVGMSGLPEDQVRMGARPRSNVRR